MTVRLPHGHGIEPDEIHGFERSEAVPGQKNFLRDMTPVAVRQALLLIEIAVFFDIEVGVAGQLGTVASIVGAIMALLLGVLSVKYQHKILLLVGVIALGVAALGCARAYNTPTYSKT